MVALLDRLLSVRNPDTDAQRRGRNLIIVTIGVIIMALLSLPLVMIQPEPGPQLVAPLAGSVICLGIIALARAGRVSVAATGLVTLLLLGLFLTPLASRQIGLVPQFFVVAVLIASVTSRPWVVGITATLAIAAVVVQGALLAGAAQHAPGAAEVVAVGAIITIVGGLIGVLGATSTAHAIQVGRLARERAEGAASNLDAVNHDLERRIEERTTALSAALAESERHAIEQERLLAENRAQQQTILAMSVPVLPVTAETLVMPLVGALDEARLQMIHACALAAIEQHHARRLLIDITGVPVIDASVAHGLLSVVDSTQLLGAELVLIGIVPEVAQALVSLGIDLHRLRTVGNLRQALEMR